MAVKAVKKVKAKKAKVMGCSVCCESKKPVKSSCCGKKMTSKDKGYW